MAGGEGSIVELIVLAHRHGCIRFRMASVGKSPIKYFLIRFTVSKCFRRLNRLLAAWVDEKMPYSPAACTRKQPQLPVAGPTPQELQHLLRVGAGQPLRLGHGLPRQKGASIVLSHGSKWITRSVWLRTL